MTSYIKREFFLYMLVDEYMGSSEDSKNETTEEVAVISNPSLTLPCFNLVI